MALVVSTFERKSIPIVAWYILSKESYMKRVMSDVLPTVNATIAKFSGPLARLAAIPQGLLAYHSVHPERPTYAIVVVSSPNHRQGPAHSLLELLQRIRI
jgi:hypothetical protein